AVSEDPRMRALSIVDQRGIETGAVVGTQHREGEIGQGQVDQGLMPSGFHYLAGTATGPDRLADKPAPSVRMAIDPVPNGGNDAARVAPNLAHVPELDAPAVPVPPGPHRSDLFPRNRDQNGLVAFQSLSD